MNGGPDPIKKLIEDLAAQAREATRLEQERVAKMTPEQRRAEVEAKERKRQTDKQRKLEDRIQKLSRPYLGYDSMPLLAIAALLHGVDPGSLTTMFPPDELRHTVDVLDSCVGVSLRPCNPGAFTPKFATRELIAIARSKRLGHFEMVARALGIESSEPPSARPPAKDVAAPALVSGPETARQEGIKRQQLVKASVLETVFLAKENGYGPFDMGALEIPRTVLLEQYEKFCHARGERPYKLTQFKRALSQAGIRLVPGISPGKATSLALLLRTGEKTKWE